MKELDGYFYLTDVSDKIDSLVAEAGKTRGQKEKKQLLSNAQVLADAYERHVGIPADKKLFKDFA